MTVTPDIVAPQSIVFTGDSITFGTPVPYYTTSVATLNAAFAPIIIDTHNSGIGSTGIAALESAVAARITNFNPTHVIIEIGINDITTLGTTLPDYLAKMTSIVNQCVAAGMSKPNILWYEIGLDGESWDSSSGSPAFNNPFDPAINTWNVAIQAKAATLGITYVPVRAAFLASAIVNNPTGLLTCGVLTLNTGPPPARNPHPNPALGQPIMAAQFIAALNITDRTKVKLH